MCILGLQSCLSTIFFIYVSVMYFCCCFFFLLKNLPFFFEFLLNDILDIFKLPEHMDNKVRSEFTSKKIISIEN